MQIVNLMTPDPVTIGPLESLSQAKMIMNAGRFRRMPVVENGDIPCPLPSASAYRGQRKSFTKILGSVDG